MRGTTQSGSINDTLTIARSIALEVGGTEPRHGSASSVYFSIALPDMEVFIRLSDHMHTPWRQGGAGTHAIHLNLASTISAADGVRKVQEAIAQRRKVLAQDFRPFTMQVGDVVRHGYHNLRVQAVRPGARAYMVHVPGKGQQWFTDQTV